MKLIILVTAQVLILWILNEIEFLHEFFSYFFVIIYLLLMLFFAHLYNHFIMVKTKVYRFYSLIICSFFAFILVSFINWLLKHS